MARPLRGAARRLLYPLYRKLETDVHPLRYLFVEITQRCNLSCRHCGSDCGSEQRPNELSTAEWLDLFAYLRQTFPIRRMAVVVTGGEPLCHPELARIARGLAAAALPWGMVTNGYALTDRRLAMLLQNGLRSVTVSLDGLRESHDWLRGKPGSFDRAVSAIGRIAAAGLPLFDVVTCVHPGNLDELPRVEALLQRLGVREWRLFSIFPKGRAAGDPELMLGGAQLRQLLGFIAERRRDQERGGVRAQFSCEGYLPPEIDRATRDEPYFCRAGISIGSVLSDGAIAACPNITRELVQGNVRTDDLKTVWDQRFQPFRDRSWMQTGACQGCPEWRRCQGNSLHLWDAERQRTALCTYKVARGAERE